MLEVQNLKIGLRNLQTETIVVHEFSLTLQAGQIVGLTGQSGSGKTCCALALAGLLPPSLRVLDGNIRFQGRLLNSKDAKTWRGVRGQGILFLPQSPLAALNPSRTIGDQLAELLPKLSPGVRRQRVAKVLEVVCLTSDKARAYPFQLSGGMRHRAMLAMALILRPRILLADEPTTGLDQAIQDEMLYHLKNMAIQDKMAILLISHDLRVISAMAGQTMVMYSGRVVENLPTSVLLTMPSHEQSRNLVNAFNRMARHHNA